MSNDETDKLGEPIEWFVIWHCYLDACKKCQDLNLYGFSGQGEIPLVLTHPKWGPVWDVITDQSLTHDNCRCGLEVHVRVLWSNIVGHKDILGFLPTGTKLEGFEELDLSGIDEYREKVKGLRAEVGMVTGEFRELEYLSFRIVSVLGRLGLPKEIDATLSRIQHLILTVRMLHAALMFLETGTIFGKALGVITLIGATLSVGGALGTAPRDIGVEMASKG